MTLNLILALSGEKFESNLISRLSHPASQIRVIDRCLDAAELLAYLRANQVDLVILMPVILLFYSFILFIYLVLF